MTTVEELIFRVTADTAKLGNPLAPFQRHIDDTTAELRDLQDEVDQLDGQTINIDVRADAIRLARENIERLREEVAEQFVIDPTVDTRRAERTIRALEAKIKALTPKEERGGGDGGAGEALAEWGELSAKIYDLAARSGVQVFSFLARSIRNAGPTGAPIIAAAIGTVLSAALAMAFSTISAATGFAAITAGIIAALSDEKIALQAAEMAADIGKEFQDLGDGIAGPMLEALAIFRQGAGRLTDILGPEFERLGGIVDLFAQKILEATDQLGPGLVLGLRAATPVLTVFAEQLPEIAHALAFFFAVLEQDAEGAALAMKLLLISIEGLIFGLAAAAHMALLPFQLLQRGIDELAKTWDALSPSLKALIIMLTPGGPLIGGLAALSQQLTSSGDAAGESASGWTLLRRAQSIIIPVVQNLEEEQRKLEEALRKATEEAERQVKVLSELFDKTFDGAMGMTRSLIDIENGWQNLYKALREAPVKTLDLDLQAGRDNATKILDQIDIVKRQRDAMLAVGVDLLKANQTFRENMMLIRTDAQNLGFGGADLDALLAPFERIPDEQIIEIQTKWSESANPDIMYAELVKQFGLPVVQKVLAEVDLESTRIAKEFFGDAFGDKAKERSMIKIDPEGFDDMKSELAALEADPKSVQVTLTAVRDATFGQVDIQIKEWDNATPSVSVLTAIEPESYGAVLATLYDLQTARLVPIKPYIDPTSLDAVTRTLNQLGARAASIPVAPSNRPVKPEENVAAAPAVVRPRIYIDGNEIRAVIRGEVNQSVSRSTVAPTRYRRLS